MLKCLESQVYNKREELNINRVYKLVDTCAAEFKAKHHIIILLLKMKLKLQMENVLQIMKVLFQIRKKIIVLGSGPKSELGKELSLIIVVYMVF